MNNKPIKILIIGASGSGKDTLANRLTQDNPPYRLYTKSYHCYIPHLHQILSYTTRPRRKNELDTHLFTTPEVLHAVPQSDIIAYTKYHGYEYWATRQQLDENELYIIDPIGAINLIHNQQAHYQFLVIWLSVPWYIRLKRIAHRNSIRYAVKRLWNDRQVFNKRMKQQIKTILNNPNDLVIQPNRNSLQLHQAGLLILQRYYTQYLPSCQIVGLY